MSSPPPRTVPLNFGRKSSSASTSISVENRYMLSDTSSSSPLPSSSPLLTPLHLTRRDECAGWQAGNCFDDQDGVVYDQQDQVEDASLPWSYYTRLQHPPPYMHQPIPSLMTKFAAHTHRNDPPLSYSSSLFSAPQTTYLCPQGDSATASDCEEYDLESMDIRIRETYFATSAERGRWLSSPIATRVRSQAIPPIRGHSSPVRALSPSPVKERLRIQRCCSIDRQIFSSLEDRDEDVCGSSSLPPSSPLSSPMSSFSFLGYDREDDSVSDPRSNPDDCHSLIGIPELSTSTACISPVEPTRTPSHEASVMVPALHHHCDSPCSIISRRTSPSPTHLPLPVDVHVHAPSAINFELDGTLSPLSQFEIELPETEPLKLPLSDTVNRLYPLRTNSLGLTADAAWSQDGPSSIRSPLRDSYHDCFDASPAFVDGPSCSTAKKGRQTTTGKPGARRAVKHVDLRSLSSSSKVQKRRGTERHSCTHLEPPNKKSKLSHRRDDSEGGRAKSRRCGGILKAERPSLSPSLTVAERSNSESTRPHGGKTRKHEGHTKLQCKMPSCSAPSVPMDMIDAEFRASLTGMLIEAFATSRATSMDALALYLVLTQAHPHLATERPKKELLEDIAAVLEGGRARCGMFEKVDSSGERSRHKVLENRWFYVAERDEDPERAALISAIMPRQKRKETKKYKQYYYRPLGKISRWDPEDAP